MCVLIFYTTFVWNPLISNLMKISPVGDELFHVDTQGDRQKHRVNKTNSCFPQIFLAQKILFSYT